MEANLKSYLDVVKLVVELLDGRVVEPEDDQSSDEDQVIETTSIGHCMPLVR